MECQDLIKGTQELNEKVKSASAFFALDLKSQARQGFVLLSNILWALPSLNTHTSP